MALSKYWGYKCISVSHLINFLQGWGRSPSVPPKFSLMHETRCRACFSNNILLIRTIVCWLDSNRNHTFSRGYPNLMRSYGGLLEPSGSNRTPLKSTFNSGKITFSKGGTPLWCPCSRGTSAPSGTKLPHQKLDTLGYHTVKTRSLYLTWHWIRIPYRVVTDGRTDRQNSHS